MTKDEFLDRIERFDPATESARLLAFLDQEYLTFRDVLTDTEYAWVGDRASTASMALALQSDAPITPMPTRHVVTVP